MGSLFSELKRRKVFRVTAAYLVGAWAILEFVSVVSPMLRLPDWIGAAVLLLLTIGLVVAVALSWMFEVTADGLKPLCEFPMYPRYNGTGDANAAASYSCVAS